MKYGRFATRLTVGLMFFVLGITKLLDPAAMASNLSSLGFPLATPLAWLVIAAEVIGGALLATGYQTRYAAVPLFIVLFVATLIVQLGLPATPSEIAGAFTGGSTVWLHLLGLTVLYEFASRGASTYAVDG